jgi:hypothetical protein
VQEVNVQPFVGHGDFLQHPGTGVPTGVGAGLLDAIVVPSDQVWQVTFWLEFVVVQETNRRSPIKRAM